MPPRNQRRPWATRTPRNWSFVALLSFTAPPQDVVPEEVIRFKHSHIAALLDEALNRPSTVGWLFGTWQVVAEVGSRSVSTYMCPKQMGVPLGNFRGKA